MSGYPVVFLLRWNVGELDYRVIHLKSNAHLIQPSGFLIQPSSGFGQSPSSRSQRIAQLIRDQTVASEVVGNGLFEFGGMVT